ncbi:hypothetical protein LSCM1_05683 [Leishmania martiniquensis]|uniref:Fungal lipase-type domain-containing protein n=1 Tax=Leishmania martiniquensis TaxID=1580590 RepID=A0A836H9C6_9TRYP|nr:hypothetical protein LSCM1_05679 [Leishmania martiniquensis]KAG5481971.1 hypothetical protein LSCM1_05683 [Leishmania martiniquensis]
MYRLPPALRTVCGACVVLCALLASLAVAQKPYSFDEAWRAHFFSRASYCKTRLISSWTCGPACRNVSNFRVTTIMYDYEMDTSGFMGLDHANKQIVVAFRGANDIEKFLREFSDTIVSYELRYICGRRCSVNLDFSHAFASLRDKTRSALLQLIRANPTYEVLVTGHSLGGALAVLAAADLQVQLNNLGGSPRYKPVSLYTFGAPRVGNSAFSRWVDALLAKGAKYRITHGRDPVVRIPSLWFGYMHTTSEVFYRTRSNDSVVMCMDSPGLEDSECSIDMVSGWTEDHMNYLGDTVKCE